MDQSVLAGVGNVYRSEVLFRHRLSPFTPGRDVRRATAGTGPSQPPDTGRLW